MSITDELIHSTVRIECQLVNGMGSCGTGFIVNFCERKNDICVPAIVTAKHVIKNASIGLFHISVADAKGIPKFGEHIPVRLDNFEHRWTMHPDEAVDLAAFPLASVLNAVRKMGKQPFYKAAGKQHLADAAFMKELSAVEDVLMIGYPTGLWDQQNNLPIVRQGITATPPYIDFEGRREFLIDCASFPGSSGSPIILRNVGAYATKQGVQIGERVKLLGVLCAGPQFTAEGQIKIVPAPTALRPIAQSPIPMNIGICVKAEQLLAFEEIYSDLLTKEMERELAEAKAVENTPPVNVSPQNAPASAEHH